MAKRQATTGAVAPTSKKVKTPSKEDITPVVVAKKSTNGKSSTSTTKTATPKSKEIPTKTKSSIISPSIEKEEITLPTTTRKRKVAPEDNDQTLVKKVASEKKDSKKKEVEVATKPTSKKGGSKEPIQPSSEATPSSSLKSALKPVVPTKTLSEADDVEFIHGFTSSSEGGADSSDEDDSDFEGDDKAIEDEKIGKGKKRVDVSMLPTIAKDDKSVQRKLAKARRKQDTERGVIYLGRIPHGFYEDEMKSYFSQFGDVTRLRLARNRKTGASKHFAYIEMSSKSVAEITAETMDNYLLLGHILKCSIVDPEKLHPDLWIGANKKWRRVPTARIERMTHDKQRTAEEIAKANARAVKKDEKRQTKMKSLGIDYEYEGFSKEAADVSMAL